MTNWSEYVFSSLLVGGMVAIKDIYGLMILPEDPIFWVDVLTNIGAYSSSDLIVQYGINKHISSQYIKDNMEVLGQPTIHGIINSVITTNVHNKDIMAQLASFQNNHLNSYTNNF